MGSPSTRAPHPHPEDCFYLRCTFADAELSEEADPESHIIHNDEYHLRHAAKETNKAMKAFGETRKRAVDFVVGSTQFLINKTEQISSSLKSPLNRDDEDASLTATQKSKSATSLTGTQRPRLRIETPPIPVLEESSSEDPEIVYEVRRNVDEDSEESVDVSHAASS